MKNSIAFFATVLTFFACGHTEKKSVDLSNDRNLTYSTNSDSALFYFYRGWEQIMDEGDWTGSEKSYRKAILLDPDFLVAQSLVGRITSDSSERKLIHDDINKRRKVVSGLELELLDAYNASLAFIIQRDRGKGVTEEVVNNWMHLSEETLHKITHAHPGEPYTKAEYIEFLHSLYGAQQALDSLNNLTTVEQKNLGFFINYAALLHSELGEFDSAFKKLDRYLELYSNPTFSSSHAYYAQVYFDMESLALAEKSVNKALELEPKHIIAQRLKVKIEDKIMDGLHSP